MAKALSPKPGMSLMSSPTSPPQLKSKKLRPRPILPPTVRSRSCITDGNSAVSNEVAAKRVAIVAMIFFIFK